MNKTITVSPEVFEQLEEIRERHRKAQKLEKLSWSNFFFTMVLSMGDAQKKMADIKRTVEKEA